MKSVDDPHLACWAGVFTGVAGQDTAFGMEAPDWDSAQAEHSEEQWKRMTYPAGRILHLVPARLVRGAASCQL